MNAHAFFIAPTGHTILEESIYDKKKLITAVHET